MLKQDDTSMRCLRKSHLKIKICLQLIQLVYAMNRKFKQPRRALKNNPNTEPSCWEMLQARIVELTRQWDAPLETQTSYIDNPGSHYYYTGHNPLRLLAKAALKLEHHFTNLPEEPNSKPPGSFQ